MIRSDHEKFCRVSRSLDFRSPVVGLLSEYRRGNIADRERKLEAEALRNHLGGLYQAWDSVLHPFPATPWKRRSMTWEWHRGKRDAYLRSLIVSHVGLSEPDNRLIVNPAAVAGRHARALAQKLPSFKVIGTDIDPNWNRVYRLLSPIIYPGLKNFEFIRENVYQPTLGRHPAAVSFFGACGSVTDGCMDYALAEESPYLICRSCCHDNIAGNMEIVRRPGGLNSFFAWKNRELAKLSRKRTDFYFTDRYSKKAYPRSREMRELMGADEIVAVAQNSSDSDICRSLIDLDRCLYLRENGYDVLYREELFFARRRSEVTD